jgi:ribosome-associated heat shock protein Hsp15
MDRIRIDKWLWAARFYKTRVLAGEACEMGRVESNGVPAKPSRDVKVGDKLKVRNDGYEYDIEVLAITSNRVSASLVSTLYSETEESRDRRLKLADARRAMQEISGWEDAARPSKKDRRDINRLRGRY